MIEIVHSWALFSLLLYLWFYRVDSHLDYFSNTVGLLCWLWHGSTGRLTGMSHLNFFFFSHSNQGNVMIAYVAQWCHRLIVESEYLHSPPSLRGWKFFLITNHYCPSSLCWAQSAIFLMMAVPDLVFSFIRTSDQNVMGFFCQKLKLKFTNICI